MADLGELHDRLAALQDGLAELRHKIDTLAGPGGPDACTAQDAAAAAAASPPSSTFLFLGRDAADQLALEISDGLRETRDEYDILTEDARDLGWAETTTAASAATATHNHPEQAHLTLGLARLESAITTAHQAFRRAQLCAQRHCEAAERREHYEALQAYVYESDDDGDGAGDDGEDIDDSDPHTAHARRLASGARSRSRHGTASHRPAAAAAQTATTAAAADLTAALRETHARIVGEVARSDFAAQTLEASSRALAELGDRYSGSATGRGDIAGGLRAARGMVRGLVAAHKSDTWYLQTSLYLLLATAAWLVFRRLLYGPLWLLMWWPLRTVLGTAVWAGGKAAVVGAGVGSGVGSGIGAATPSGAPLSSPGLNNDPATSIAVPDVHASVAPGGSGSGSPASLIDEVGQIVDHISATAASATAAASDDAPNPMKRMWEEPVEAVKHEEQQRKEVEEAAAAQDEGKGKGKEDSVDDAAGGRRNKDEL